MISFCYYTCLTTLILSYRNILVQTLTICESSKSQETRRRTIKSILLYEILLIGYTGSNLNESLIWRNIIQTDIDLRNSHTDLTLPKPKREFPKMSFHYNGAKFTVAKKMTTC